MPRPQRKAKWSAVAVGRILKNEFYVGILVQGKRTTPNHKVKKTITKPSEEWIRLADNHEAIITKEEFATVNELLASDTRVAPNKTEAYTFSGLLYCADCCNQLVRSSVCKNGKTYFYYMCGKNRTTKQCTSHRISDTSLADGVLAALRQHIANIIEMEHIYHTAIYLRLSVEDSGTNSEEVIQNQRYMVEQFVNSQKDMKLLSVYQDNGFTGTNFQRPAFEQMMDDVRDRKIDCIVVKDLSRFGRNYIETGYYLEKIFPFLNVRFVAVTDNYDTLKNSGSDDMVASLKNIVNSLVAKDISHKSGYCSSSKTACRRIYWSICTLWIYEESRP